MDLLDLMQEKDPRVFTNPEIIEIKGRCYRSFPIQVVKQEHVQLPEYTDNDTDMINCVDLDEDFDIKVTKSGKFMTKFSVASYFYPDLIGVKGSKRKDIENDTGTTIKFPKEGKSEEILILGNTERNVALARNRINLVILRLREKHPITHFVSIPVVSSEIKRNFEIFKKDLLTGPPVRGLDESIFQTPEKFHLTIATLVLLDENEKNEAVAVMHESNMKVLQRHFANVEPLRIRLKGLEIMNDDPGEVDVLYGKVNISPEKYNEQFQDFVDEMRTFLARKCLIRTQSEQVKLHVTLINSLYRKKSNVEVEEKPRDTKKNPRKAFDASYILSKFKDFNFGEADLDFLHLSVRFNNVSNKYYEALVTIPFKEEQ